MASGVFVGLSTIDLVYGVDEFPAPNKKIEAGSQDVYVGGPATNAAIAFAHLGGAATLVTAVGRHQLANVIREELDRYSVRLLDLNPDFDGVPAISSVSVDRSGSRTVVSANAIRSREFTVEASTDLCQEAGVVLVDGHFMQACQAWAAAARAHGAPVVLDGGSWKAGTEELLASVDIAICSADFHPPGCNDEDDVFDYLKSLGVAGIAITNGAAPVRYLCAEVAGSVQPPKVEVVDTMGAGDIFHGAFCYFTSIGEGFVQALEKAAKIAAESCRFHGTREWMNCTRSARA